MKTDPKKSLISKRRYILINLLFRKEKRFILIIGLFFLIAGVCYPYPGIAMWIGFILAAYSAVANDSIQTLGTFIAASADKKWWILWLYIGTIFIATISVSWLLFDGDVSFQRLSSKGFAQAPVSFHFLQIAAPIFLLIITRMRMPVSTTFLLLTSFTTSSGAIAGVLQKSVIGYFIAFLVALAVWTLIYPLIRSWFKGTAHIGWTVLQWLTSGFLWSLWIVQDAANIAVFLPRSLNLGQLLFFLLIIFFGLGLIFKLRGDKIQEVVNEKTDVSDIRAATLIDMVYVLILIVFTWVNTVPMSTTWVFIGLLGGRELGLKIHKPAHLGKTWKLITKDLTYAVAGLIISIVVAVAANDLLQNELRKFLGF